MSQIEPLLPHPDSGREEIAAADAGRGAPEPAPGFGVPGEHADAPGDDAGASPDGAPDGDESPFRPPDPDELQGD